MLSYPHGVDNYVDKLWTMCGKVELFCGQNKNLQYLMLIKAVLY